MNLLSTTIAVAFRAFVAVSPPRAARIRRQLYPALSSILEESFLLLIASGSHIIITKSSRALADLLHRNRLGNRMRTAFVAPLPVALAIILGSLSVARAHAQDPFEIHVYEYESLKPRMFTLESHLNYVALGTKTADGPVAPFNHQFHMTYELTGGITDNVSLGFMLLSAKRSGYGLDYAGWRLLPHFYVPKNGTGHSELGWWVSFPSSGARMRKTLAESRFGQSWKRISDAFKST